MSLSILASFEKSYDFGMTDLLYEDRHMGFRVRVFGDRIELGSIGMAEVVPMSQVASVTMSLANGIVETTGGKRIRFVRKQATYDAISEALAAFRASQAVGQPSNGVADEIAKLAKLRDEKILSDEEFESQKRRLLGAKPTATGPVQKAAAEIPKRRLPPGLQVVADVTSGKGNRRDRIGLVVMAVVLALIVISALSR